MSETRKVASLIGLRDVVYCLLTEDSSEKTSYGEVKKLVGAVSMSISEQNSEADVQYCDDGEFDAVYPDPEFSGDLTLADLPPAQAAEILGATLDQNGVLIRRGGDKPPYIALGFKSVKANNVDRYVWLYKGRGTIQNEDYATKQGADLTRQNAKIAMTFVKRLSDGAWKAMVDTDEPNFESVKATFFNAPYTPNLAT